MKRRYKSMEKKKKKKRGPQAGLRWNNISHYANKLSDHTEISLHFDVSTSVKSDDCISQSCVTLLSKSVHRKAELPK